MQGFTFSDQPGPYGVDSRIVGLLPGSALAVANLDSGYFLIPEMFNLILPGITNLAPDFINPPVIFANVNQPVSFSTAALDPDGDSLVYRLRPVGATAPYATGFTYLYPIMANPAFNLNSRTGIITFTPTAYNAAAGPGATANKYLVGLEVDEFRKINGVVTKLGTIQRNILINVVNHPNQAPVLTASSQSNPVAPNTIINVSPGTSLTINFNASDPDPSDQVFPGSNATMVLPGATFGMTLGQNPNGGVLYWTPTAADVRDEPYFFNVTATDDACPYPASTTHTYGIRVGQALGLKHNQNRPLFFSAFPNPFTEGLSFKFDLQTKAESILIYNLLGQQIDQIALQQSGSGEKQISWENAGKFPKGTYVARLVTEGKTLQTLRFIKQ